MTTNEMSVADIGETALVERLIAICGRSGPDVLVGPGDDAAVLAAPDGRVVVTTDMAVQGRHFRVDWSSALDVGHRVAAANLADIVAMGARPTGLVVALALPPSTTVVWVEDLMRGLVEEAEAVDARVIGGDVTSGDQVVISVTALGNLADAPPVRRDGARDGDIVAVAGRLGWAAAGLAVLSRGFRSPRALVDAYRRPQPAYAAGRAAVEAGAHALMDVSDGLLLDAGRLARSSGVGIDIASGDLQIGEPVAAAAAAYNLDPLQWILGGGDDHAFLATFAPADELAEGFSAIGVVRGDLAPGTVLVDGRAPEVPPGFEHFRR